MRRVRSTRGSRRSAPSIVPVSDAPYGTTDQSTECIARLCDAFTGLAGRIDALITEVGTTRQPAVNVPVEVAKPESRAPNNENVASPPYLVTDTREHHASELTWLNAASCVPASNANIPNPWLQKLVPAAQVDIFDGDPVQWPHFIASFKTLVHDALTSDADRLAVLTQLLSPRLRDGFAGMLTLPGMYRTVLRDLESIYGNKSTVIKAHANRLFSIAALRSDSVAELERFYLALNGPVTIMKANEWSEELRSTLLASQIVTKFTPRLRDDWARHCETCGPKDPTLQDLAEWLQRRLIQKRRASLHDGPSQEESRSHRPEGRRGRTYNVRVATSSGPARSQPCASCNADAHSVDSCPEFVNMSPSERMDAIKRLRLCLRCLQRGHQKRDCRSRIRCSIDACTGRHHTLLHDAPRLFPADQVAHASHNETPQAAACNGDPTTGVQRVGDKSRVLCAVVRLMVSHGSRHESTFALLDSGAEVSLMTQSLAERLQVKGQSRQINLRTINGTASRPAIETTCEVSSMGGHRVFPVDPVVVLEDLDLGTSAAGWSTDLTKWPHLAGLPLATVDAQRVELLIGINAPTALRFEDVKEPPKGTKGPVAVKTAFGWTLVGHVGKSATLNATIGFVTPRGCVRCSGFKELWDAQWHVEATGSEPANVRPTREEEEALEIMRSTIRFDGEKYEVGLLWKPQHPTLRDNRRQALRCFFSQERRVLGSPGLADEMRKWFKQLLTDGYAAPVADWEATPSSGKVWYLPYHAVQNNTGKTRIVFNASAQFGGVSLNDCLYKGPDYLTSLPEQLLRFRERRIPVSADIEKMYYQVRVPETDRSVLRFVWRNPGEREAPRTFHMCVHIFGARSSPSVCMYALKHAATARQTQYPVAADRVLRAMYVDNLLDSTDTVQQALELYEQATALLKEAGFRLRKWATSAPAVLDQIPTQERADCLVSLSGDVQPCERVLGLNWDCHADTFKFVVNAPSNAKPTKRTMFSTVAKQFDPLGLLAPITIGAKMILQEIWRECCDWDSTPSNPLLTRWQIWAKELQLVPGITFERCLRRHDGDTTLHVFSDASTSAYGAVVYVVSENSKQIRHCSLAMARAKVAPIRALTIPRLELQAAVIAARLAAVVQTTLSIPREKTTYWSDSSTVLRWVHASNKRWSVFVENRVSEILQLSSAKHWRYVPTEENPADDLSRSVPVSQLGSQSRWQRGPPFLRQGPEHWPKWPPDRVGSDDEANTEARIMSIVPEDDNVLLSFINRSSDVLHLIAVVARVAEFADRCRRKHKAVKAREEYLQRSWAVCVRTVQEYAFPEECVALAKGRHIKQDSRLLRLTPFAAEEEVMRVHGRLQNAALPFEARHPAILPKQHNFTDQVIRHVHVQRRHAGVEDTLAHIRARFWIVDGRSAVRRLLRQCVHCRKQHGKAFRPKEAPLPACRVVQPPHVFWSTGLDYFGPIYVNIRRSTVKKWICIFTCMTVRAVHLEICSSLDVDAFLNAFRRFMARRGRPAEVWSDNGTNFVAGNKELQAGLRKLRERGFPGNDALREIKWRFNPPAAPNFGGVWERLVRSAKRALGSTLNLQHLAEDVLATAVAEVEGILNGRPLTYVSTDPNDDEPLTPNHFLIGRAYATIPSDIFTPEETISRRSYRAAQALANHFWTRWSKEYVQTLLVGQRNQRTGEAIAVGDVVLIADITTPRSIWPVGRVEQLYPGIDGTSRVADVRTTHTIKRRPVNKLVLLCRPTRDTSEGMLRPEAAAKQT